MSEFDILIVGGGIAGASLGSVLARRGRTRVAIAEAEDHCAMHSTGRSAAFWLASYGGPKIIPLTLASQPLFESRWPGGDVPLLRPRGAIFIAQQEGDLAQVMDGDPSRSLDRMPMDRAALEVEIPGLRAGWDYGLSEPSCADIDVAALHQACLASFRKAGGTLILAAPLLSARRFAGKWLVQLGEQEVAAGTIVNAAGAWADAVATRCGLDRIGIQPKRRTMVQLRVDRQGIRGLPQVLDALGRFYFKGEGDNVVWLSPHDEVDTDPCDAAPEEMDVAIAIDRFQSAVDWGVAAVERKWAGLRSFAPDRLPLYGFDPTAESFFWCAGQGGFGIQTAPAAAHIAAALLLREAVGDTFSAIEADAFSPARFRA